MESGLCSLGITMFTLITVYATAAVSLSTIAVLTYRRALLRRRIFQFHLES